MIRVHRHYVEMPTCFSTDIGSDGTRETEEAKKHFREQARRREAAALQPAPLRDKSKRTKGRKPKYDEANPKFEFKVYKEAKTILQHLFANKCGYCEIDYGGAASDVEHFRPKAEIHYEQDGSVRVYPEGYYWLGADWHNLIYSCQHCNRGQTHDHQEYPNAPIERRVSGKGNFFPLSDESKRLKPCEPVDEEEPFRLLLDPCRDQPHLHLQFHTDGFVTARSIDGRPSAMGQASIRHYGLSRVNLIDRRKSTANKLLFAVSGLNKDMKRLDKHPAPENFQVVRDTLEHIHHEYLDTKNPFRAMVMTLFYTYADLVLLKKHMSPARNKPAPVLE